MSVKTEVQLYLLMMSFVVMEEVEIDPEILYLDQMAKREYQKYQAVHQLGAM